MQRQRLKSSHYFVSEILPSAAMELALVLSTKKKDMKNLKTWECSLRKSSVYLHLLPPKWPFGGWFWNVAHLDLLTIYRLNFLSKKSLSFGLTTSTIKPKRFPLFNAFPPPIHDNILLPMNVGWDQFWLMEVFPWFSLSKTSGKIDLFTTIIPIVWFRSLRMKIKVVKFHGTSILRCWKF